MMRDTCDRYDKPVRWASWPFAPYPVKPVERWGKIYRKQPLSAPEPIIGLSPVRSARWMQSLECSCVLGWCSHVCHLCCSEGSGSLSSARSCACAGRWEQRRDQSRSPGSSQNVRATTFSDSSNHLLVGSIPLVGVGCSHAYTHQCHASHQLADRAT